MTIKKVPIVQNILNANDEIATVNRRLFDQNKVFTINLMASPGAGKTSLILQTIQNLQNKFRIGVIEGDTAPVTIDADKVIQMGSPAVQINTGGDCHLDAVMVQNGLHELEMDKLDVIIIENVGNLVCPAAFQLGTHVSVLIASVPEGDDKPYKYPNIYRGLQALVLNKTDLLPYVKFDEKYFRRGVEILNPGLAYFPLSCSTGEGFNTWITWIEKNIHLIKQ
jgi:hydrogenase nickel incorporation protein HypB